ncbi:MAG: GAF domain-containing protein [Rhodopseudomonas sp.]|uniref:ATP-binding protein n=1 Tax=Rhodopseudomonas sp. TaxID=1078 RepID=UPI0017B1833B|nr:ATP-binding protein [Rhodopseudomonas sp.]NVN87298.1 GAF domain-containing protein [Rhodopseudomonas sp.]
MDPAKADDIVTARNVDLSTCDRELVQFPDAIQPHGAMLTVDDQSNLILHASANCADFLGKPPDAVVGSTIAAVLGPSWRNLTETLHRMPLDSGPVTIARESFVGTERGFNLFAHRCGGLIILELEKSSAAGAAPNLYSQVRADLARLQDVKGLKDFFDVAVERIRAFTGYDRVMAYRFDEDGSGHVVAEARRDDLEPYLGLHYPASDIPAPARRLFSLSWVRHLPDVDYTPVPMIAATNRPASGPVDMSFASLRSVSVMYTGYLKNMGVRSTLVMPLVKEGKLWGLISAMHHAAPRHLTHETRMAAEFLAHTLSLLMSAKEDAELFGRIKAMKATSERLIQALAVEANVVKALRAPDTLQLLATRVEAGGLALVSDHDVTSTGKTPSHDQVRDLVRWLADRASPLFTTDRLSSLYEPGQAFARDASGVLAVRISPKLPEFVLWFRPEQVETVAWAGDPHKPVEVSESDGMLRLRPRNSFALWKESVRNRSIPWREDEKEAVVRLAAAIGDIIAERATRVERISRELGASRSELGRYADTASHELKEHLRGIHHLTTALRRRQGDVLDEEGQQQVATILKLTQRMDSLVDALLEQAEIGRSELSLQTVDLDAIVDAALLPFARQLAEHNIEVRRPASLGSATCNREWVSEVFANLIANAIKYNDKPARWIEIGVEQGHPARYYVRDNGIGIAETDQQLVFQMFHRLNEPEQYGGGAGVGLAMTRKIIERHGGRIWVQSRPGDGSTFYFTLSPDDDIRP